MVRTIFDPFENESEAIDNFVLCEGDDSVSSSLFGDLSSFVSSVSIRRGEVGLGELPSNGIGAFSGLGLEDFGGDRRGSGSIGFGGDPVLSFSTTKR